MLTKDEFSQALYQFLKVYPFEPIQISNCPTLIINFLDLEFQNFSKDQKKIEDLENCNITNYSIFSNVDICIRYVKERYSLQSDPSTFLLFAYVCLRHSHKGLFFLKELLCTSAAHFIESQDLLFLCEIQLARISNFSILFHKKQTERINQSIFNYSLRFQLQNDPSLFIFNEKTPSDAMLWLADHLFSEIRLNDRDHTNIFRYPLMVELNHFYQDFSAFIESAEQYYKCFKIDNRTFPKSIGERAELRLALLGAESYYQKTSCLNSKEIKKLILLLLLNQSYYFPEYLKSSMLVNDQLELSLIFKDLLSNNREIAESLLRVVLKIPELAQLLIREIFDYLNQNKLKQYDLLQDVIPLILGMKEKFYTGELVSFSKRLIEQFKTREEFENLGVAYSLWFCVELETGLTCFKTEIDELLQQDHRENVLYGFLRVFLGDMHSSTALIENVFDTQERFSVAKNLHQLLLKYVKYEDDINHESGVVFSYSIRDELQDMRRIILSKILNLNLIEACQYFREMVRLSSENEYISFIYSEKLNQSLVRLCDSKVWTLKELFSYFESSQLPITSKIQFFEIAKHSVLSIKKWFERGDDSLAPVYKKIPSELDQERLLAFHLKLELSKYPSLIVVAQEVPLANGQRIDIQVRSLELDCSIPLELKILDNHWTGPNLSHHLMNQLILDYMREEKTTFGIYLLIQLSENVSKKVIHNRMVSGDEIAGALNELAEQYIDSNGFAKEVSTFLINYSLRTQKNAYQ